MAPVVQISGKRASVRQKPGEYYLDVPELTFLRFALKRTFIGSRDNLSARVSTLRCDPSKYKAPTPNGERCISKMLPMRRARKCSIQQVPEAGVMAVTGRYTVMESGRGC